MINNIKTTIVDDYLYVWEKLNTDGIRLLHMYGKIPEAYVCDTIENLPVTEIAPYCFTEKKKEALEAAGITVPYDMTSLSGQYVSRIILPDSLTKIGGLAFYNCRNLSEIEMSAAAPDVDGDAFMNCICLHIIILRGDAGEKSYLRQILAQITWKIIICWQNHEKNTAQAIFFEYDQSYDEIGPAHIFKLNMAGVGFRARQSFSGRVFAWKQYDDTFIEAKALECEKDLLDMAFSRIKYPYELDMEAKKIYLTYVQEHKKALSQIIIDEKNTDNLNCLLEIDRISGGSADEFNVRKIIDAQFITEMIDEAAQAGWGEGSVILLRYKKKNISKRRSERFKF